MRCMLLLLYMLCAKIPAFSSKKGKSTLAGKSDTYVQITNVTEYLVHARWLSGGGTSVCSYMQLTRLTIE